MRPKTPQACALFYDRDLLLHHGVSSGDDKTSQDVVELLGIQLSPVRLKCALLGLGVVKVALNSSVGTPLPEGFEGLDEVTWT